MKKHLITVVVAFATAAGAMALADPGEVSASPTTFEQRDFPCQEDEVLGYAPEFGPDHVGCIHIDQIR
ncbi:hypothetical protein SEA_KERBEROS_86 [Mycobacterium phage Kerberos]|uniref:hypothetical protein n=1 Tax=Mycobacterium phage Chy5 TaxID=1327948 RepID=UPI00032B2A59|nr:hypothetical protein M178_gp78 [Mycobacterium phage Chy5]AOQ27918.1 hypothetical protein SEA_POMAR16_86 [Mycobacterium phage Pomar16]APC43134.1 hypothetical protein SEA_KERBEROS_86 [Mycobacterium phage Kerberos]APC46202.1 hypothetical protein PBI_STARSTUFF_86 [Mycobacterium phage StarStuff]AXH48947.1 hypothetical protein SEA_TOMATHAN_86 [Mycobacterium phage Tomathan]QBP28744.1 hypothetical protein SEA_DBQU4N_86 [Mycobacterium phage DBQu4n]UXE05500.1 membrane protein [Mycobacterium phage Du